EEETAEQSHPGARCPNSPSSQSPGIQPHEWTYEEQFKQLYELDADPKRKEFLDDLFSFMQKRGTPVNRVPIMAKQVLDLYALFRLVTAKGGLVEVINRKVWREVTRGLSLPTTITSAAFTLRTQYMKYLYPYECETRALSSPGELQAAIDSNRREGRRQAY
ncbi:AT rich interactive domain 3C (Bright like), partial [Mus musculus]